MTDIDRSETPEPTKKAARLQEHPNQAPEGPSSMNPPRNITEIDTDSDVSVSSEPIILNAYRKRRHRPTTKTSIEMSTSKSDLTREVFVEPTTSSQAWADEMENANQTKGNISYSNTNTQNDTPVTPMTIESGFTTPTKTISKHKLSSYLRRKSPSPITNDNPYQPLERLIPERETANVSQAKTNTWTKPKPPKPTTKTPSNPPIVFKGVITDHRKFREEISGSIKMGYYLKFTSTNTLLYVKEKTEHDAYLNQLKATVENTDLEFHTYTPQNDRNHAFVLRGLWGNIEINELKDAITSQGVEVINIFKMRTKRTPLYLVVVSNKSTLRDLQQKVKYILHTKIAWERRRSDRQISQCHRCQAWGHATSNCFNHPRCVKCAGAHLSQNCNKPENELPKCINCKGDHVASFPGCPEYTRRIHILETQLEKAAPARTYVPAPPPPENVWAKRAAAAAAINAANVTTADAANEGPRRIPTTRPEREMGPMKSGAEHTSRDHVPSTKPSTPADTSSATAGFDELMFELGRLNKLINLTETTKAIRTLNNMLQSSTSPIQTLTTLQDFYNTILPTYNIMPSHSNF